MSGSPRAAESVPKGPPTALQKERTYTNTQDNVPYRRGVQSVHRARPFIQPTRASDVLRGERLEYVRVSSLIALYGYQHAMVKSGKRDAGQAHGK